VRGAVRKDLSACQDKLARRLKGQRTLADGGDAPEGGVVETAVTVEGLEGELRACRKSGVLVNAEVCVAAKRQFDALMAVPHDGLMCGPKSRAADIIEDNFESCAVFGDNSVDVRSKDLTKDEAKMIAEAIRIHQTLTEEEFLRRLKEFVFTCTDVPKKTEPENPPL